MTIGDGTPGGISNWAGTGGGVGGQNWMPLPTDLTSKTAFGAAYGQTIITGPQPQRLISGLTISQYVNVYALSGNKSIVWLGDIRVAVNTGYPIEAGKQIVVDTGNTIDRWWVTTDGSTATVAYSTASNQETL